MDVTTLLNSENTMLSGKGQTQKAAYLYIHKYVKQTYLYIHLYIQEISGGRK